jgi:PGF-CTERM protein
MRPEALLTAVAAAALLVTVGAALVVPGFVAEPESDDPPARLDVAETTLETGEVTGETVTFDVTAFVAHRGGPAENVSVVVRAIDDSGVVSDTAREDRRTLEGDGEHEFPVPVTVPREGGYEIRTILYVDGERVDVASASVSGVEALTPPYAETNVGFHRFDRQPAVEYTIDSTDDGDVTLAVTSYLTNGGDEAESGFRITVTARHAAANVVADRAETSVGSVAAGRTEFVETAVTVPNESNYYLDVTLWRDGVVLDSARTAANLDPRRTVDVEERTESVAFEAGEFETDRDGRPRGETEDAAGGAESQPGFGAPVAVVALLFGAVAARRWSR